MPAETGTMQADDILPFQGQVSLTRIVDAPIERVFAAWTDPRHFAKWWGPDGFANPVCELDVRPGGAIRVVMRAPDGTEYPMSGTFHEVEPPTRLVFTSVAEDREGTAHLEGHNCVTLVAEGDRTRITVEARARALTHAGTFYLKGMEAGWEQTVAGLGAYVAA